jgi:hypothetical protein
MVDIDDTAETQVPLAAAPDDPDAGADDDPALEIVPEDGTPEDDVPSLIIEDTEPPGVPDGV